MKSFLKILVTSIFLFIIFCVPVTNGIREAASGDDVHFLTLFSLDFISEGKDLGQHIRKWDDKMKDNDVFSKWIRPRTQLFRYNVMGDIPTKAIIGVDNWLFHRDGVDYLLHPNYKHPLFYKNAMAFDTTLPDGVTINLKNPVYAILDFKEQLLKRGIHLLMIPVPGKAVIYPEKLNPKIKGTLQSPTVLLMKELEAKGVEWFDLYSILQRAKNETNDLIYLERDTHWTPKGMMIAAEAIAEKLKSYEWFASGHYDGEEILFTTTDTLLHRIGDVSTEKMLGNKLSKIWSKQNTTVSQVVDINKAQPYFQAEKAGAYDSSRIIWIGDSFSRIYQTPEDAEYGGTHSAGVISHVAKKLNEPIWSQVADGQGASGVRRKFLGKVWRDPEFLNGKKVLIWQFVEREVKFSRDGWQLLEFPPLASR